MARGEHAVEPFYRLGFAGHNSRYIDVSLTLPASDEGYRLSLPAWIPGSYLLRDFARHLVGKQARDRDGNSVRIEPVDQQTWDLAPSRTPVEVSYRVYCADFSVRSAHADSTHVFFNGTSVFLRVHGAEHARHEVVFDGTGLPGAWRVATTLPDMAVDERGFGDYAAPDYEALIDHPVEIADFVERQFTAGGVLHRMVFTNPLPDTDFDRIAADVARICETEIELFDGAPFDEYLFLVALDDSGFGGLEHRDSTALIFPRGHLPAVTARGVSKEYQRFLSLCAHEYFHNWNVKRIRPSAFAGLPLDRPAHTRLLWVFEGFTSYFDDWLVRHAGLIDETQYLAALEETVNRAMRGKGWSRQTLEESSFYAWTRFYQQDANAVNAIVSYYTRGAVVALMLDLMLRERGASLMDVMRRLWEEHGERPLPEGESVERMIEETMGEPMGAFFEQALRSTEPLDVAGLLARFGVAMVPRGEQEGPDAGVRVDERDDRSAPVQIVFEDRPGAAAGLAVGDRIIAIDGFAVSGLDWRMRLARRRSGDRLRLHVFREGRLLEMTLELAPECHNQHRLERKAGDIRTEARFAAWLAVAER
ncbi:MAG: M61 family metallopeptidase [Guyparkeria sp.]